MGLSGMVSTSAKRFVAVYHKVMDIDILKPPGRIPYYIEKLSNGRFVATLVTFAVDNYSYHKVVEDHLRFIAVVPWSGLDRKFLLSLIGFVARNAKAIDVLHLYHIRYGTLVKGLVYKLLNPVGFLCWNLTENGPCGIVSIAKNCGDPQSGGTALGCTPSCFGLSFVSPTRSPSKHVSFMTTCGDRIVGHLTGNYSSIHMAWI